MTGRVLFVAANPSIDRLYEVDALTVGAIHRPATVAAVPGGKGLNAARAAARIGGRVAVVGLVGGRAGDWIRERIAERGIEAAWAAAPGETRTCVSIVDRSTGAVTEIYEHGEPVDASAWADLEGLVERALAGGDVAAIAFSGSLPPGAPADGFARVAAMARAPGGTARSVPVLADTYGQALTAVLGVGPAIVKVNADEAAAATGLAVPDGLAAAEAAQVLRAAGAGAAVVTLGVDGAVVATEAGTARLIPPDMRGAYPVGSGDAFLGGMAVGLARGDDVLAAARLGMAAGIANAMVPGAGELDPGAIDPILEAIVDA
jgi:1-phosphofructokinase family hexose kinase